MSHDGKPWNPYLAGALAGLVSIGSVWFAGKYFGTYLLVDLELAKLSIKSTILGANIIGGLLFGLGWGALGYCPGTSVGAVAEGRWYALWGVAGMLAGAALFAELFPAMKDSVLTWGYLGKITMPQLLGINHWFVIVPFVAGTILLFRWIEKKRL